MFPKLEQGTRAAQLSCLKKLQPQGRLGEMITLLRNTKNQST